MKREKVLLVHNYYQNSGGEDVVFLAEADLLRQFGHDVMEYTDTNYRISSMSRVTLVGKTLWSRSSYVSLRDILRQNRPDLVHFHNTFPLISPSGYSACQDENIPVVQTLHNYRLLCPAATFFRDEGVCEACLGKRIPANAVFHRCYRDSYLQSLGTTTMLALHNFLQTWQRKIDVFIALSNFSKNKFVEAGFSPDKVVVKPNFLSNIPCGKTGEGKYALFIGRLSPEKGLATLLKAWESLPEIPLKIVGDGILHDLIRDTSKKYPNIEFLGFQTNDNVYALLADAKFLVFPSEWYEGFPMTLLEAFVFGKPILAAKIGSVAEIVQEGVTGLFFDPRDAAMLAEKAQWLWEHPLEIDTMGENARLEYENKYTPEKNYQQLMNIYDRVLSESN